MNFLPCPPDRRRLHNRRVYPLGIAEIHVMRGQRTRMARARPPSSAPRSSRVPGSGTGAATAIVCGAVMLGC